MLWILQITNILGVANTVDTPDIVSIVDRLEGGEDAIIDAGFVPYSIFDIKEIAGE